MLSCGTRAAGEDAEGVVGAQRGAAEHGSRGEGEERGAVAAQEDEGGQAANTSSAVDWRPRARRPDGGARSHPTCVPASRTPSTTTTAPTRERVRPQRPGFEMLRKCVQSVEERQRDRPVARYESSEREERRFFLFFFFFFSSSFLFFFFFFFFFLAARESAVKIAG